jgi:capsular exopolysaccharide synthesis family protein
MSPTTASRDLRGADSDGQAFIRYYRVLREHLWLVILCTVLCVGAAVVYVKLAPRRYQATAELVVTPVSSNNTVLAQLPIQQSSGDITTDITTAAALVTTDQVADGVISALHLNTTAPALLGNLQATPVGQSTIVAVQAQASTPRMAALLANAFVHQRIATSTSVMHHFLSANIPGLQASLARIPAAQQNGPGSLGQQLEQYRALLKEPDPTLGVAQLATAPTSPYTPKTKLSLIAGLLAGVLLGVGAAFGFNALDPRLRRDEQLRSLLGAPILARIPREHVRRAHRPLLPAELSFVSHEGYRRLRTTLAARGSDGGPRAILVTGSSPSEGKTTTAINLAFALAQGGVRVILIEADLRRPTIGPSLQCRPAFGTAEVLTGEVELADALQPLTIDETALRVLVAARAGDDLADSLSTAAARDLIADAKALADFVVIDSPPLTAVVDALPLARYADEVLVVARLGRSRLGKLADLDELLGQQGAAVTGLVVIGEPPPRGSSYYYAGDDGGATRERDRDRARAARAAARAGTERNGPARAATEPNGPARAATERNGPARAAAERDAGLAQTEGAGTAHPGPDPEPERSSAASPHN